MRRFFVLGALMTVTNIARADAIADLCARLTPQGKAKLGVPCEQIKPDGHDLARTFLKPLAEHGPFTAEAITTNTTERLPGHKTRAAQLMQHQVELLGGYGLQNVGTPINWHHAPKNDWQWPTHLSRHYYLMPLGYVYRATGDNRYAQEIVTWLRDWVKRNPLDSPDLQQNSGSWSLRYAENKNPATKEATFKGYVDGPWTSLSAHARVEYWTQLFQLIHDAPAMTNENVAIFLNSLLGDHRQLMLDYPRQMNQYQGVAASLLMLGFYYPDFQAAKEAEIEGRQRLAQHAAREIYGDGSMAEVSPNYGMGMVQRLHELLKKGTELGRTPNERLEERVRLAMRYFAFTSDPMGRSPRLAKGGGSVRSALQNLNATFNDPEVQFIASGGKAGQEPKALHYSFPWAGHHVFRSGWDEKATWLFFDSGPRGTGHHDAAQNNIQLFSNGEWLLTDPGYYSYSGEGEEGAMAKYLYSTAAHNTALVDGQNQIPRPPGTPWAANEQEGEYNWRVEPVPAAQGTYSYGYGSDGAIKVNHFREVRFESAERIVVEDSFEGEGQHELWLHWQLAPGRKANLAQTGFTSESPQTTMRLQFEVEQPIKPIKQPITLKQFEGEKKPLAGWYSETYGRLSPAPMVRTSVTTDLPATITTVITIERK